MKRALSYLVFVIVVVAALAYMLGGDEEASQTSKTNPSEVEGAEPGADDSAAKTKVFVSDHLGISFSYPGSLTMEPVVDYETLFIGSDASCMQNCTGIKFLSIQSKFSDGKENPLLVDFNKEGVKDSGSFLVIAKTAEGADAQVSLYNKKDTIYQFTAPFADFLSEIAETFQEIPKVSTLKIPSTDPREFKFESCGVLADYQTQPFYGDLLQKLTTLQRYHQAILVSQFGVTKIIPDDVTDICYSSAGSMVIMLLAGKQYCEQGSVVKYETDTGKIEFADLSPATMVPSGLSGCGSLRNFGKRTGRFISATAEFGDAGVSMKWSLIYDYIDNVLFAKEVCTVKQSEEGGAAQTECKPL